MASKNTTKYNIYIQYIYIVASKYNLKYSKEEDDIIINQLRKLRVNLRNISKLIINNTIYLQF